MGEIAERLKESEGTLAEKIYSHLAEIVDAKKKTKDLRGFAMIERTDMEQAFAKIGK